MATHDPFKALTTLDSAGGTHRYYRLGAVGDPAAIDALPYTIKVLLEKPPAATWTTVATTSSTPRTT